MGFDTLPLERCQLNPLGRKSVKEYFLSRGISNSLQPRLDSAALGFLVFGLHSDGDHHVARDRFHDAFRTGRKGCSPGSRENYDLRQDLFKLMCDAACARDRLNGGCSITISLSGALRPGSHVTPENIKADVYLPRYLIEERPHFKPIIAALVQTFIENIGVEISERWLRGAAAMHWDFRGGETTALPGALPIFPESANDSCHYVFWGHTAGELEELIAAEQDPGHDAHQHAPEGTGPDPEVVRLTEEILRLNAENARLRELSEQQAAEIVALRAAEQQRAEEVRFTFDPKPPSASMSQAPTPRATSPLPVPASVGSTPSGDQRRSKARSTRSEENTAASDDIRATATPTPTPKKASRAARSHAHIEPGVSAIPSSKASSTSASRRANTPVYVVPLGSPFSTPVRGSASPTRPPLHHVSPISVPSSDSETESSVTVSSYASSARTTFLRSPTSARAASSRNLFSSRPTSSHNPHNPFLQRTLSSQATSSGHTPLTEPLPFVAGFGVHSARYIVSIGHTKLGNNTVQRVFDLYPSVLWVDELVKALEIAKDQALELACAMLRDCEDQGLVPLEG
ncbi:hypothetical protein FOMPIDRAFT_1055766 [Fomitopsis schrenkii]|uniref:Uncharacterized protein n=1 Tax=Fomitopsis schrenkii TaxID=2126942 RepID=S8DLU2_FOMSC|nr:hypothetical protein FOMPIDRAFT_1055766 [Fomitopsis schrenkii]